MAGEVKTTTGSEASGYTVIELVLVLVILGIMAVAVLPRFVDPGDFRVAGFTDQLFSSLQYARQQAIAQRRNVCVTVAANSSISLTRTAAFGGACAGAGALLNPATGAAFVLPAPNGVTLVDAGGVALPLTFFFNAVGQPSAAQALNVQLNGVNQRVVTVAAVTGYVQ